MWIDDYVRDDSLFGERHIFMRNQRSDDSFLSVSRCEFISQLRNTSIANSYLYEAIAFNRFTEEDCVYDTFLGGAHAYGRVSLRWTLDFELSILFKKSWWARSPDQY